MIETKVLVLHRLNCKEINKLKTVWYGHTKVASGKNEEPMLLMASSIKITICTLIPQWHYHNLARSR
jgi:hypothetical protein